MDINETVYNTLDTFTDEIQESTKELSSLEEKIKSNRYTQQTLKEDIYPQRDAIRKRIDDTAEKAFNAANALIKQYRDDAAEANYLDPSKLTDDVKLLQPGITLTAGDIQGMLKRNEGNRTMLQVILRYAEEHKIDTGNVVYCGGEAEEKTAQELETILYYYKKWIREKNAKAMLNEFFHVTDPSRW